MKRLLFVIILSAMLAGCNTNPTIDETEKPELAVDHFKMAKDAYANGQYDIARQHYEQIVERHPHYEQGLFRLGNIAMRDDKLGKAQSYYKRVIGIKPTHAQAHHNLAILYLREANIHLNYYIANDEKSDNQAIGRLMNAMDQYAENKAPRKTELDALAELVDSE